MSIVALDGFVGIGINTANGRIHWLKGNDDQGPIDFNIAGGGGGGIAWNWDFDTSTVEADPGSKKFRLNNSDPALATKFIINDISNSGADASSILTVLSAGDKIYTQQLDTAGNNISVTVVSVTDNTGFFTIEFTVDDSGTIFGSAKACGFILSFSANGGTGDMTKAVYDPTGVNGDAFLMSNMVETAGAKVLTSAERSAITANSAKVTNATHTGDVTGDTVLTIADDAVTLAKMAEMATDSILGRDTAGTGNPEVLTPSQVRTIINVEDNADVTDETNVKSSLDGATIPTTTVAGTDKVLLQDADDSDNLKTATAQQIADLATGSNTFSDSLFRVQDNADATKQIALEASAITTATTRTITMPDTDVDLGDIATNNAKVTNANHTGDATGATVLTIANNVVSLAKMSNLDTSRIIGRVTGGTGVPESLTATQVRTLINVADGATTDQTDAEIETAYNNQVAIVSQAEAEAGTVTAVRRWTPERVKQAVLKLAPLEFAFALSETSGDLVAATNVESFRAPFAFTWTKVIIEVGTAGTGGTLITVDVNINGATGLSTKATIDASEFTSEDAATPAVISTSAIAKDDLFQFDIDDIGSTIAGERLKIWIIGTR